MNMLDRIEKIVSLSDENGFSGSFFEQAGEHLEEMTKVFQISAVQAALFSVLLNNRDNDGVSVETVASAVKCGKIQILKFLDDFDALEKKKLIRAVPAFGHSGKKDQPVYRIPMDVINAVRKGVAYECTDYKDLTPDDFFDAANDLLNMAGENDISTDTLITELNILMEYNKKLEFVKKQKEYELGGYSLAVLFIFCCALLFDGEETLELISLQRILGLGAVRQIGHRLKSLKHPLAVKGLIEPDCQNGVADTSRFRLTEKARDELLAEVEIKEKSKRRFDNIISANDLNEKKLFYSKKIERRIEELVDLLKEENFKNIQQRLLENKMRCGFACILSGPPGTGKTETAYQIARATGRDIMRVDISETKSKWFGDSEKLIKKVFDRYRFAKKREGIAPILLFNEADAVLGKRMSLGDSRSGPGQTENAIQNIILQEMEELEGILIATTNMTGNLDTAFERRFLYKIEFDKPDTDTKTSIWQSMVSDLSCEDAAVLAKNFDFSGGQIENIARKRMVTGILKGETLALSGIMELCREEELVKTRSTKIGFNLD